MLNKFRLKEIVGVIVWIFNTLPQILCRLLAHISPGITDAGKRIIFHVGGLGIVAHKREVFGNANSPFQYFGNNRLSH